MTPARLRRAGAAAASGLLLALARPPFDLGPLALVALVPLFVAWRGRGPRGAAAYAFVGGAAYYAVLVSWSWYFGAVAIVPFVAALAAEHDLQMSRRLLGEEIGRQRGVVRRRVVHHSSNCGHE